MSVVSSFKMMKLPLIYLALCSLAHAYVQRMTVNRRPTAFRPGVMLQRPWMHPKIVQAASHRTPYVIYRHQHHPQRHVIKQMPQRPVYTAWKTTTRLPIPVTTEREFMRAASAPTHPDGGAIHTIPAPNLSLSERPIVVIDGDIGPSSSETPKQTYEVTEKYPDSAVFQVAKIEQPIGFSKATSLTSPELEELVRNGAALQVASELGLSALALPQHAVLSHPQQHQHHQHQFEQQQPLHHQQQQFVHHQPVHQQQFVHQQPVQYQQFHQQQFLNQPILHQFNHQPLHPQPSHHQSVMEPQIVEQQSIGNEQHVVSQPSVVHHQSIIPQRFTVQGFNIVPSQPELVHAGPDGIVISPNALYQPDPAFMQKLQNQLLQRFPGVEFVPYATDLQPQAQAQVQVQAQPQPQPQPDIYLLEGEQITKQTPSSFVAKDNHKNIFQRETHEGTYVTLLPTTLDYNVTERNVEVTHVEPQNATFELVAEESRPGTTTIRYVESTTEQQNTSPIYYAQVGQNVGNVVASGFYSAINDVRAAAAVAQVDKPQTTQNDIENTTNVVSTTPITPELQPYFVQKPEKGENNQTVNEIKPILGIPFAKTSDSVNVAYSLLSNDDKERKLSNDGSIYAGQIVEATISEDQDFNLEKANILSRRAPIRLVAVSENRDTTTTPKITVVKAKIPPKSKLTFDAKTGEPVLRIYASYIDSPLHKELIASKLANSKHVKEVQSRKDAVDDWKAAAVEAIDKSQGSDLNQLTQFGLKLRDRSDGPITLFEDYEDEPPSY